MNTRTGRREKIQINLNQYPSEKKKRKRKQKRKSTIINVESVFVSNFGSDFDTDSGDSESGGGSYNMASQPSPVEIFDGKDFDLWLIRVEVQLATKELLDLIRSSELESSYRAATSEERETNDEWKTFRIRNAKALAIIMSRVSQNVLARVRNSSTAFHMLYTLKRLYVIKSDVGRDAARAKLYNLRYHEGGDMTRYIEKFERFVHEFRYMGGSVTETEEVEIFRTSLPANFNNIRAWFSLLGDDEKTLETLKRKCVEDAEYKVRDEKSSGGVSRANRAGMVNWRVRSQSHSNSSPPKRGDDANAPNRSIQCFNCGGKGHIARACPSNPKNSTNSRRERDESRRSDDRKQNEDDVRKKTTTDVREKSKEKSNEKSKALYSFEAKVQEKETIPRAFISRVNHRSSPEPEKVGMANESLSESCPENCTTVRGRIDDCVNVDSGGTFIKKSKCHRMEADINGFKEQIVAQQFLFDSGATDHLIGDQSLFDVMEELPPNVQVKAFIDEFTATPTHKGTVDIVVVNLNGEIVLIRLNNVLYVPGLNTNLMSEDRLTLNGAGVEIVSEYAHIYDRRNGNKSLMVARRFDRGKWIKFVLQRDAQKCTNEEIFTLLGESNILFANSATHRILSLQSDHDRRLAQLYHRRMGHISAQYLKKLQSVAEGIPKFEVNADQFYDCEICIKAKSTRAPHTAERRRGVRIYEVVNSDVIGPMKEARTGEKYLLNFIDDYSMFSVTYPMKFRSEIINVLKKYVTKAEQSFPDVRITSLRCDNAKEYISGAVKEYCDSRGIETDASNPYTPQQNARSERYNRKLEERIRAIMFQGRIPFDEWPLVSKMAEYLINRTPSRMLKGWKTPFELYYGRKPNLSNIRIGGCATWVYIEKFNRDDTKFGSCADEKTLMGYTSNGYVLMNPVTKKLYRSCNVKFIEEKSYVDVLRDRENNPHENLYTEDQPLDDPVELDHTYASVWSSCRHSATRLSDQVPNTFNEAILSSFAQQWKEAMRMEIDALIENETWVVVPRTNQRTITARWVYVVKHDGEKEFAKARLVAREYRSIRNYDELEVYSPVIGMNIMRWMFSVANRRGYVIFQIDVKTAFLNGKLDPDTDPVYVEIPQGLNYDSKNQLLLLKKALYGLKVASRRWYERLTTLLLNYGFQNFIPDQCLFYRCTESLSLMVIIYVDDLLICSSSETEARSLICGLQTEFVIKVIEKPVIFLGIEIERNKSKQQVMLRQTRYIEKLVRKFGLDDANDIDTPMEANLRISKSAEPNEIEGLRSIIGGLLFVARNTRPDVLYAVNYLSRFQDRATGEVFKYAKRILRYLKTTKNHGLVYESKGDRPVMAYVDAAFADSKDDQFQSTGGHLVFVFGDLIGWNTRKQKRTATSTAEAEYQALNDSVREVAVIRHLFVTLFKEYSPALIYEDNTSAMRIAKGTESTVSRFLLTKDYAIRQAIGDGEIEIESVESTSQLADILTKALGKSRFIVLRDQILK